MRLPRFWDELETLFGGGAAEAALVEVEPAPPASSEVEEEADPSEDAPSTSQGTGPPGQGIPSQERASRRKVAHPGRSGSAAAATPPALVVRPATSEIPVGMPPCPPLPAMTDRIPDCQNPARLVSSALWRVFPVGNPTLQARSGVPAELSPPLTGRTYNCRLCQFKADGKSSLWIHIRRDHLSVALCCPVCDRLYWGTAALRAHANKHTDIEVRARLERTQRETRALRRGISESVASLTNFAVARRGVEALQQYKDAPSPAPPAEEAMEEAAKPDVTSSVKEEVEQDEDLAEEED